MFRKSKQLDRCGYVFSINKRQWKILVDIGLLPDVEKVKFSNEELYYVGRIPGVTKEGALEIEDLFDAKTLRLEIVKQYIARGSIFRIVDDSNKYPGWAILVPVKDVDVARKVLREAKNILIAREKMFEVLSEE